MSERSDALTELGDAGVLDGLRWAYVSAVSRSLEYYSEADGHDATWLGTTRYILFRNRLDRVFACDRYTSEFEGDTVGMDQLFEELGERDILDMPRLSPSPVKRSNLSGSAGWACGRWRILLAAGQHEKLDEMPWPQKSPTKQLVAQEAYRDPDRPTLFDHLRDDEIPWLRSRTNIDPESDLITLVVAHSLDPVTGSAELLLGRPLWNLGGGRSWHWSHDLLDRPSRKSGRLRSDHSLLPKPRIVEDVVVRLRRPSETQRDGRARDDV